MIFFFYEKKSHPGLVQSRGIGERERENKKLVRREKIREREKQRDGDRGRDLVETQKMVEEKLL